MHWQTIICVDYVLVCFTQWIVFSESELCVLQEFQKDSLKCEFNIDNGKTVPARVEEVSNGRVIIECQSLPVSYL